MLVLDQLFPDFCVELDRLVRESARPELAEQLPNLQVIDRCNCGDADCAHFYTAPRANGPYGTGHTNVVLSPRKGLIILDVVWSTIVAIEVLERPDVKRILDAAIPLSK